MLLVGELRSYSDVCVLLRELGAARRLSVEKVPLTQAVGRVLAREVTCRATVPGFDNSAMDGFALKSSLTGSAAPVRLPVVARVFAGDAPMKAGRSGAVEIMTGAPMPKGLDGVVKVEDVEVAGGHVTLSGPVAPGENVRRAGSDFSPGQRVLEPGVTLKAEQLLALAAIGVSEVTVARRPKVAVISTGKELMPHGTKRLAAGQIRDATGPYLQAAFAQRGAQVRVFGPVRDDPAHFKRLVRRVLSNEYDLIVTTGAVSMGQADFIPSALTELGALTLFHKVAIRPGKPLLCAHFGRKGPVVLGLPGNPVATAVGVRFFADVLLRAFSGASPERMTAATLVESARKPEGLRCFFKGQMEQHRVRVMEGQASYMVSPLLDFNCWVELPEEGAAIEAGAQVAVWPLTPGEL